MNDTVGCRNDVLIASAATSRAVLFLLFHIVEMARQTGKTDFALHWLQKMSLHAMGMLGSTGGGQLELTHQSRSIAVTSAGIVDLSQVSTHVQKVQALRATWTAMDGLGDFEAASMLSVVRFVALSKKERKSRSMRPFSSNMLQLLLEIKNGVATLLGNAVDAHVQHVITSNPAVADRQIPSRKKRASEPSQNVLALGDQRPAKKQVLSDVNSVWALLEEARTSGVSMRVLGKTKMKEKQGGFNEGSVQYWVDKLTAMYAARSKLSVHGIRFWNIVTDASTFSSRETCVSILYSPERDVAVYLPSQAVQGNLISATELNLDESVERAVATRKADRVASYRLITALSHQLSVVSNFRINVSSFHILDTNDDFFDQGGLGLALAPLNPNFLRVVDKFPNGNFKSVHILNKRTALLKNVLSFDFVNVIIAVIN